MEEKWINNLQQKMHSHEEPEPLGLWDDIEVAINKKSPTPIINRRKAVLWSAIGGIAAMLTLIFLLGRRDTALLTVPTNVERPMAEQKIQKLTRDKTTSKIVDQIEEKKTLLATNTTSYTEQDASNTIKHTFVETSDKEDATKKLEYETIIESEKETQKGSDNKEAVVAKERQAQKQDNLANGNREYESLDNYNFRKRPNNRGKLIASVYSTNLPNTTGQSNGYGELIAKTTLPRQMSANSIQEQSNAGDVIFSNIGEETHTKTEHKQPIKAGLSIRYQLNDKFGIESGLTYTYLSSNLTSGTDKSLYKTEQSLQYIGLPLNVSYSLWENRQLSFYVTAGGLAEKCIAVKSHTDYIIDNQIIPNDDDETIKDKPFQFSLNSSVGVQYNISHKLGLFAEPGLGYYFDNGSDIETIYKERPLNFNLKIGLRVNIN